MVAQVQSHILPAGRSRRWPNEKRGKKEKGGSTCSANAIARPGASALSPPAGRGQLYQRQPRGGAGADGDGDRHRDPDPDATVVRAIQALGFAGLRELKQTMERWFGTSVTSAEKMRRRSPHSPATSIPVLILCWKAPAGLRGPVAGRQPRGGGPGGGVAQRRAPGGDLRHRRLGDPRRVHRPAVQPHWPAGLRDEPHGL